MSPIWLAASAWSRAPIAALRRSRRSRTRLFRQSCGRNSPRLPKAPGSRPIGFGAAAGEAATACRAAGERRRLRPPPYCAARHNSKTSCPATRVSTVRAAERGLEAGRLLASNRADLPGGGDFEDLEIVGSAQFVVLEPARDIDGVAGFAAQRLAGFEFELDPAVKHIDELIRADMVVPAGRLRHAGLCLGDLRPHLAAAGVL